MPHKTYYKYASGVLDGSILACTYVKQCCKKFYSLINDDKYEFRENNVDKIINFCNNITHSNNKNLEIDIQDWQTFIFAYIFGFYYKGTEERLIKQAYIEVARKNGKSTLISLIALYMMIGDGEYKSEVDIVANSHKQSKILYGMSSDYCQSIDPKGKYFKRYRDSIIFDSTKSKIQALASDTTSLDGYNPYCFIIDEVHEQKDSLLYNVLRTGQASRKNPLGILITTAGLNMDSFCYQYRQNCIDILYGLKEDDSTFSIIYTLDDEDDFRDDKVWVKSNPNLGVSVRGSYLKEQVLQAENNPSLSSNIQTKNFNIWSQTFDVWIDDEYLVKSAKPIPLDFFIGKQVIVGVDLASVSDLTAISLMTEEDGIYYFWSRYYIPTSALSHNYNCVKYKDWRSQGFLKAVNGNITDYEVITDDFCGMREKGIYITNIFYDPWNSVQWSIDMTNRGFMLTPFSQTIGNFNRPTKEFERLIKSDRIIYDANPITRYCFNNASLRVDYNGNAKPQKSGSENNKIDGVISMVQALGGYLTEPQYTALV